MKLMLPKDIFNNPIPPRLFLCTINGKRMGELPAYSVNLNGKWNSYSDISFSIDRTYTDVLTGEDKVHPLFDKTEGLRQVLAEGMAQFVLQDDETVYGEKDSKTMTAFSLEYATAGTKYIENFRVNTGDVDSVEVIYESNKYTEGTTKDDMYRLAIPDKYDAKESYYHRVYTDNDSYDYEPIQVKDESDYKKHFGDDIDKESILYIHGYANVQFYDKYTPELSLLHLVFQYIPEWKIGYVDVDLCHKEKQFSVDRMAVYDFLMNDVSDAIGCVFEWDTISRTVNVYAEANDGLTDNDTIDSQWNTDIYITRENLANEINIKVSTDNIKTKLKVAGSDTLDIREVNLGQNYIMNLDYYHNDDWMEQDLVEAYQRYLDAVKKYSPQYTAAVQGRAKAYDAYNELMNAVPADGNVVLVGDEFKKLYCTYAPINTAYYKNTLVADTLISEQSTIDELYSDDSFTTKINTDTLDDGKQFIVQGLQFKYSNGNFVYIGNLLTTSMEVIVGTEDKNYKNGKLYLYSVHEDTDANKSDNILLTLKNANSDKATIRIYNAGTKDVPEYLIQSLVVSATTGTSTAAKTYTIQQWVSGKLTSDLMEFDGYMISSIGTMGAYLVLAKDEKEEATLEEYGIKLLQEKHDTYVKIFQTQTEAMYSQQDYQCIVQNEQPEGVYDAGTKWLDTNSSPVKLYEYNKDNKTWNEINANTEISSDDEEHYRNYQRYIDNYDKMVAVQKMLIKKQREAEFYLNGYKLDTPIIYKDGDSDVVFYKAADAYFRTSDDPNYAVIITGGAVTKDLITTYTFTTPKAKGKFVIYLDGTTAYLAQAESTLIYQAKMNVLNQRTELRNFFTDEQWIALSPLIREDEYIDDNFLFTSYESEEEKLEIPRQLMEEASKKLKTLSQPSLEFSMTMANILALPEFSPFVQSESPQFALGKFIRIELSPGLVKRARLLECSINFDDLSDFSCTFGNLITTKSEIDLHAELLSQAVQAGKTVATAAGTWQAGADKADRLEEEIVNGLQNVALKIGASNGQAISWDSTGMHFRKFKDGSTTEYEPEEMAIINNALVATNDSWRTSKAAFGKYVVDGEERWGPIAEYVTAQTIEGKLLKGGSIQIGDPNKEGGSLFVVHEDGSVEIKSNGQDKYASQSAIDIIDSAYRFRIVLLYDGSTIFSDINQTCTITCNVYDYDTLITDKVIAANGTFAWMRSSSENDDVWNAAHIKQGANANKITLTTTDVVKNSNFACSVDFDETKITT